MKIVVIGSTSGIGSALANHLKASGASVCGIARRETDSENPSRLAIAADVSDWNSISEAAQRIERIWGSVDALIHCAGIQGATGPAMMLSPADWTATVRANIDGAFHSVAAFHPMLCASPAAAKGCRAKVLCFSGGGAAAARPNFSAYGVAKTAVVRLVETLAVEWADAGYPIDINAIAPGAIHTAMTEEVIRMGPDRVGEKEYAAALKIAAQGDEPMRRLCGLVDYLLSVQSDGVTGRLLSAPWDPWPLAQGVKDALGASDLFTLRRVTLEDRKA